MTAHNVDVRLTVDDYKQMPDDLRYELIEGDLELTPSPNYVHHELVTRLFERLRDFLRHHNVGGKVFIAPFDVVLSEHNVVQPDVFYISAERRGIITMDNIQGAPDLVIEVLSPSTARRDRGPKRKIYARFGVREWWLVDPEARMVEVARLTQRGLETVRVYPPPLCAESMILPGFRVDVAALFDGLEPGARD